MHSAESLCAVWSVWAQVDDGFSERMNTPYMRAALAIHRAGLSSVFNAYAAADQSSSLEARRTQGHTTVASHPHRALSLRALLTLHALL